MTRVLVTGATGLIGRAVVTILRSRPGVDVIATSRRPTPDTALAADLTGAAGVAAVARLEPDLVIHLAGVRTGTAEELIDGNAVATGRLLSALPTGTPVVVAGSSAEYAPGQAGPIGEEAPTGPVSPYGWSKLAQTTIARGIAADRSLRLTVVRPFNVVAPDLPTDTALGNMAARLRQADHGRLAIEVGRLDVVRDYVPVWYVAECVAGLALVPSAEGIYNVCSGIGIELRAVLAALGAMAGIEVEAIPDESLTALPASLAVVGDPSRLEGTLGTSLRPTPDQVAAWALGD